MKLSVIGCSFRETPIELRERLGFDGDKVDRALDELSVRYGDERSTRSTASFRDLFPRLQTPRANFRVVTLY